MDILNITKEKGEKFKILAGTDRSQIGVMTIGPGEDSGPKEIHDGDQVIYVIEGEADVEFEGEHAALHEGEALIIPAGADHSIKNNGIKTLFFLTFYAPPAY